MNRLVKLSTIIFYLFIFTHAANAQLIGVSADYPIDYSASKTGVVGSSVGITHPLPFIPNIGVTRADLHEDRIRQGGFRKRIEMSGVR